VKLKETGRIGIKLKFVKSQIKTLICRV